MTRWLSELTPEQEAFLSTQREKWIALGLSTEPANRAEAEAGVRDAYQATGLEPPRFMIWVDSPYAGVFAQAVAPAAITATLAADTAATHQVTAQVTAQVTDQVWAQVGAQVWDQVRAQVRAQVSAQVRAQVGAWQRALVSDYYGIWWSSWIETMRGLGVTGLDPWRGLERIAANAYWWWCFTGFVVLSERPRFVKRDAQNRLHAEGGPAIVFPDGWAVHAWHGTRVPEDFWGWDGGRVMEERNDEIRRAAIERIGWHEFLNGLQLVAEVDDPGNEGMTLSLFDLDSDAGRRLLGDDEWEEVPRLIVMDNASLDKGGHRRRYSRLVPGTIIDPIEAIAASYGLTRDEYSALEAAR